MTSLISSTCWVPKGRALRNPIKYSIEDDEQEQENLALMEMTRLRLEDAKDGLKKKEKEERGEGEGDEEWEDTSDQNEAEKEVDEDMMDADLEPTGETNGNDKTTSDPNDLSAYNLDTYDDEDEDVGRATGPFSNVKGLAYYENPDEDPYITLGKENKGEDDEDSEPSSELEVLPSDRLIITAKTQDEVSQLEVYVYDADDDDPTSTTSDPSLYVHHDLLLPAMPLCLEWMDLGIGEGAGEDRNERMRDQASGGGGWLSKAGKGNLIAVGTMDPEVEIWSLDVVDAIYPHSILGPPPGGLPTTTTTNGAEVDMEDEDDSTNKKKKKKKSKKKKKPAKPLSNPDFHVDSVLALSWNRSHKNFLASASADVTVKLWDLERSLPSTSSSTTSGSGAFRSFDSVHSDKITNLEWNPTSSAVMLSASYDKTVKVWDTRAPDAGVGLRIDGYGGGVGGDFDVECVKWDPWDEAGFMLTLESGLVQSFDSRTLSSSPSSTSSSPVKPLWTLSAHDGPVSAFDISPHLKGVFVTGGTDKMTKVWNAEKTAEGGNWDLGMVIGRDLGVGKVFSASFCPDDPLTLCVGGSNGNLQVWDPSTKKGGAIEKLFGDRLRQAGKDLDRLKGRDGVVGVAAEDKDTDEDD